MVLNDSGQINGIFFEIIERADSIEERGVVCLSAQRYRLIVGVDVALPDMVVDVVGFDRVSWNEHLEEGIVNCV